MTVKERTLLVATPTKIEQRHKKSCRFECCPCQDEFQPDTAATSAVDSDLQTKALIRWLSGTSVPRIDDEEAANQPNLCPNRLHGSIAILNAIRDACRPYLEASAPSPNISASLYPKDNKHSNSSLNGKTTYEDSFPSLPSISTSAAPPTLLVGRKKSKSQKITSTTNVGGKVLSNHPNHANNQPSNSWDATHRRPIADIQPQKDSNTSSGNASPTDQHASFSSLAIADPKSVLKSSNSITICSTDNSVHTGIDMSSHQKLERLVLIYGTIVRSQLAPSLLMEFHLLLRLLSLPDKNRTQKAKDLNGTQQYHEIFRNEQSCRDFAAKTLSDLEPVIVNLGYETLKMLVSFPAMQIHCLGLCTTMQDVIHVGKPTLIFDTDRKALGHNTNTPHLTLPFDHARDSRHNYRSAQMNLVFKEREELRDAFLYQLRAFQDIRGRLMEQEQTEKSIVSLQHASKEMLSNVSPGNTIWFVNFVCDLLLQTGLAPIGETDSEVLRQIGDKKRLQKLHMRFTSTSVQTNRSSKKLRIDQRGQSSHALTTPDQSFTGHQEFFSVFIRAGNSYSFNIHLKNRLAQLVHEMTAVNETKDLYDYIAKSQMLAKFLGMLDFSPNWDLAVEAISDRGYDMISSPIDVRKCIEEAWIQRRLVVVIPWVIQYLGMMKWDAITRRFNYYSNTFALLWGIKIHCFPDRISSHSVYQTNMMLVSLQLESLFCDVVGLVPSQQLPRVNLPTRKSDTSQPTGLIPLDDLPLWFSQHSSSSLIPHLKDLCDLLQDLVQNNEKMTNSAPKKVRPDTISSVGGGMESRLVSQLTVSGNMSPWSIKRSRTPNKNVGINERLVDSFFHQHKDLQQLCETVVDRAIKNFAHTASFVCILPIFKNGAVAFDEYLSRSPRMVLVEYTTLLNVLDSKAEEAATTLMKDHFDRTITGTLYLLAPPETQHKVLEIASSLAISHAFQQGRNIIHSIIRQEKQKLVEEFVRKENKFMAGVPLNASKRDRSVVLDAIDAGNSFQNLAVLSASLRQFQRVEVSDLAGIDIGLLSLKEQAEKALEHLRRYFIGAGIPPSVLDFEMCLISVLKMFFANPLHRHLLGAVIEVANVLCLLGKLGYAESSKQEIESLLCDTDNMLILIDAANHGMSEETYPINYETMGNFLFILLEGSIIGSRSLEAALLQTVTVKHGAKMVSHVILNKLALSRTGMTDASGGLVIMVRLQRVLSDGKVGT